MASAGKERKKDIRKLWISFWSYSVGVFLVYSAFGTLLSLQSSINVVDGLGTFTMATIYVTAVLFTPLCVPILLRKFREKKCICGSEITYVIYIAANMYPEFYTMIPASILVGMGDCILWSCMQPLNSFFARQYSKVTGNPANHESRFSGYFFAVFQMAKIPGNLVSYTVLYAFNSKEVINATSQNFSEFNSTFANFEPDKLNYCGANDCQDHNMVEDAIDQYVPANKVAIYILMSIMGLLSILAIVLHIVFIPGNDQNSEVPAQDIQTISENNQKACVNKAFDDKSEEVNVGIASIDNGSANDEIQTKKNMKKQGYRELTLHTLRDVGLQLIDSKQLLMTAIIIYAGLDYGFITSELTRSYSSCVFGVEWVSLHLLAYGIGACLVSFSIGKLSKRIPRNAFFALSAVVDASMYTYCIFWDAHQATHISVIPMYFLLGGMQGIWISLTQIVQMEYFHGRLDVASPVWNLWFMFGIGLQYAWSTSLCVSSKIYTQLGMLVIGITGYAIAEKLHRKTKSQHTNKTKIKAIDVSRPKKIKKHENCV